MAFAEVGIELGFSGEGIAEKALVVACSNPAYQITVGKEIVAVDPAYFRPTEVDLLIGDATKAKQKLGWAPKYNLAGIVKEMVAKDLQTFKQRLAKEYSS